MLAIGDAALGDRIAEWRARSREGAMTDDREVRGS
jgi:hypothetical protein